MGVAADRFAIQQGEAALALLFHSAIGTLSFGHYFVIRHLCLGEPALIRDHP